MFAPHPRFSQHNRQPGAIAEQVWRGLQAFRSPRHFFAASRKPRTFDLQGPRYRACARHTRDRSLIACLLFAVIT